MNNPAHAAVKSAETDSYTEAWQHYDAAADYTEDQVIDALIDAARSAGEFSAAMPTGEAANILEKWSNDGGKWDPRELWRVRVRERKLHLSPVDTPAEKSDADGPRQRREGAWKDGEGRDRFNDAVVTGEATPQWVALLDRQMTFLLPGDRHRDAEQKTWKNKTATLRQWLEGGAGGTLTQHVEMKRKGFMPVVFGASAGKKRAANAMVSVDCLGLDIDSGSSRIEAEEKAVTAGLSLVSYTSFNNGTERSLVPRDPILKHFKIEEDPTDEQVRQYLTDKGGHTAAHIRSVRIVNQHVPTDEGVKIELAHDPLEKFRLVVPLAETLMIHTLGATQIKQQARFKALLRGLAMKFGVIMDEACVDVSRAFYLPSHPPGRPGAITVVQGRGLTLDELDEVAPPTARNDSDPRTPNGASLKRWAVDGAGRLQLKQLIEDHAPDKMRFSKGDVLVVECPFDEWHSNAGDSDDTACHVCDADQVAEQGFVWKCKHNACSGHDRLDMIAKALKDGWFDEELLRAEDYLLPYDGDGIDPLSPEEERHAEAKQQGANFEARAAEFTKNASDAEIRALVEEAFKSGVDRSTRAKINDALAKNTSLGKTEIKSFWKELDAEQREKDKQRAKAEGRITAAVVNEWDFRDICNYAERRIHEANAESPTIFHYLTGLADVRQDSRGRTYINDVSRDHFAHRVNSVARFVRLSDEGNGQGVSAPKDVVSHLFAGDLKHFPELRGIIATPTFTASGELLTTPGYDPNSRLFYSPDPSLTVPQVSAKPSSKDVSEAKRLLVEEILADFPLGGLSRHEIMDACLPPDGGVGAPTPAVAHAIAMTLQPFLRDMIPGTAPGYAINKKLPGTGATKLVNALSTIYSGRPTPAVALPTTPEEMTKTLLPVLKSGAENIFFDNINHSVDSGELASAMTTPTYMARLLGSSAMVEVDVRITWIITGNKLSLSRELSRRFVLIDLDAKTATPEDRTGFRHRELEEWVQNNRGRLVWACLTLIQNWIARGKPDFTARHLASYDAWSKIMGGVLAEAGIGGFLENSAKALASDEEDPVQQLMNRLAEYPPGTVFVTKINKRAPEGAVGIKELLEDFYDGEALRVPTWGYDKASGGGTEYGNIAVLSQRLAKAMASPYRCGDIELTFTQGERTGGNSAMWRSIHSAPLDKVSVESGAEAA